MDTDEVWFHVHTERAKLALLLQGLAPDQWDRPTLCDGWAVRHVAAHVISSAEVTASEVIRSLWRGRGRFNRAIYLEGIRWGQRSPDEILAAYQRNAQSRRHALGTSHWEPLVDVLVHTQDIAIPLGIIHSMPTVAAQAAANRVWSFPFPFWARRRLGRFRLIADDVDWSAGNGPEIRGPISALLLLMTGRTASLPLLEGDGLELLPQHQRGDHPRGTIQ